MPQRLLRLLSLLQVRRGWSGAELTRRLGVSARTLRRDVERLRELGYQVEGTPGAAGGYRMVSGQDLPPLPLSDEEAVAIALGLITATGVGESALSALTKLERVLPRRLRPRMAALQDSASTMAHAVEPPGVDPAVLGSLASSCREHVVTGFDHRDRAGEVRERRVEPHHLVAHGGHWYLIAHDTGRDAWRTFRVDRISGPCATHRRFAPRPLPAPDPATFLARRLAAATYTHTVLVTVELSAEAFRARFHGPLPGGIEPLGEHACRVRVSARSLDLACQYTAAVLALGEPYTLEAPPEVVERLHGVGRGLVRSTDRFAEQVRER